MFLEHPGAGDQDNQTGEIGVDIIRYRYQSDADATFCFEDEDPGASHLAILFDSEDNEVMRVQANGECATEFIRAGKYFLEIVHDGLAQDILPIFAIPGQNGEQAANKVDTDQGLFESVKSQFSEFINDLRDIVTQNAKAQTPSPVQNNVSILLNTKECKQCILTGANLVNAPLSGADLRSAILLNANMSGADLTDANLSSSGGDKTILCGAILTSANLTNSNLCGADMFDDQCSQFNTPGATIEDTTFDGATWVTSDCNTGEEPCVSGGPELTSVVGGEGSALTCELSAESDSVDTSLFLDTFHICLPGSVGQCNLITVDSIMMVQAWGGFGGQCFSSSIGTNCGRAQGGYAQTITTLGDLNSGLAPILYYYLGLNGDDCNEDISGGGGASTALSPNVPITEIEILLAFAGGGGTSTNNCSVVNNSCGGNGGTTIATTSSNDFIAVGKGQDGGVRTRNCAVCAKRSGTGGNVDGGMGGVAKDGAVGEAGMDNFGGFGGCVGSGCTLTGWSNSSLTSADIGNSGQGGSSPTPDKGCPGGGGGGGVGGGGAGSRVKTLILGISGAGGGGGSSAAQSTETCSSAPTSKPALPNAGSCGDDNTCAAGNVGVSCFNDSDCDTQPGGSVRLVFFNDSDC